MAGIDPEDIGQRFKRLGSVASSAGEAVIAKLHDLAQEINKLVGSDSPALRSIVQRLEQAAHVASSAPALTNAPAQAPDPTPAATDAASPSEEATTSTEDSSTPNSNDSANTSSTESKE
jgi:hypothetical protein